MAFYGIYSGELYKVTARALSTSLTIDGSWWENSGLYCESFDPFHARARLYH